MGHTAAVRQAIERGKVPQPVTTAGPNIHGAGNTGQDPEGSKFPLDQTRKQGQYGVSHGLLHRVKHLPQPQYVGGHMV